MAPDFFEVSEVSKALLIKLLTEVECSRFHLKYDFCTTRKYVRGPAMHYQATTPCLPDMLFLETMSKGGCVI